MKTNELKALIERAMTDEHLMTGEQIEEIRAAERHLKRMGSGLAAEVVRLRDFRETVKRACKELEDSPLSFRATVVAAILDTETED